MYNTQRIFNQKLNFDRLFCGSEKGPEDGKAYTNVYDTIHFTWANKFIRDIFLKFFSGMVAECFEYVFSVY